MLQSIPSEIIAGVCRGDIVPYLGPGVLADVTGVESGQPIPADSDSLILAMNNGRPMAPRLMYEFPRAAMDVELKKGRKSVASFLSRTYGQIRWTRAAVHDWLAGIRPPYVVDINRDMQLQDSYAATPHLLVRGIARIGGTDYRFWIDQYDGEHYARVTPEQADASLPVLFKPMGSPIPEPATYIASDADYVDYVTELMGGFGIPSFVKDYRKGKQYLLLGMRLTRDTERMVLSDIIYAAGSPAGWAVIPEPTDKERRFCDRAGIEVIEAGLGDFADGEAAVLSAGMARC